MTNRFLAFLSAWALTWILVPPVEAQCTNGSVNNPSQEYDACAGGDPYYLAWSKKTFEMTSTVSCQMNGWMGTGFGNPDTKEVKAAGNCGPGAGSPPTCAGEVSIPYVYGFTGTTWRWDVYKTPAQWNGAGCDFFSPSVEDINVAAEGCQDSFCCSLADECAEHVGANWSNCECQLTPIILGLENTELRLTGERDGVMFDLLPDGIKERVAWTRPGSRDGFLVLDRNENGTIDSGYELFGSASVQPPTEYRNGFNALVPFDLNNDEVIDKNDPVFNSLRIWTDRNHNGESETSELKTLAERGVVSISLDYHETKKVDHHGNSFPLMSTIRVKNGKRIIERFAWDVVLVSRQ